MIQKVDVQQYLDGKRKVLSLEVVYVDGKKVTYNERDFDKVRYPLRRAVVVYDPKDSRTITINGDAIVANRVVVRAKSK